VLVCLLLLLPFFFLFLSFYSFLCLQLTLMLLCLPCLQFLLDGDLSYNPPVRKGAFLGFMVNKWLDNKYGPLGFPSTSLASPTVRSEKLLDAKLLTNYWEKSEDPRAGGDD